MSDVYRRCASMLLLRPTGAEEATDFPYDILLVHKPRKSDAWQFPQGGLEDGETTEQAAVREAKEEAGVSARVVFKSSAEYQYDFPDSYRRFRPDNVCGQRIEFVVAMAEEDCVVRVDGEEIDSYVWVRPEQMGDYIERPEYLDIARFVVQEAAEKIG